VISKLRTGDWAIQDGPRSYAHPDFQRHRDRVRQPSDDVRRPRSPAVLGDAPTGLLIASSLADILFISVLANRGIAMSSLSIRVLAFELTAAIVFGILLNFVKIPVFACLQLA
jgi:hypothetical protein